MNGVIKRMLPDSRAGITTKLENKVPAKSIRQSLRQYVRLAPFVVGLASYLGSITACAQDDQWFSLRNHNPFLQVYGLPSFQTAELAPAGGYRLGVTLDIANHADADETPDESVLIDGESYVLSLSMRNRVSSRLELGIDLPLVAHSSGLFDNVIEGWHDLLSISNSKRAGPSNQLQLQYSGDATAPFALTESGFGIGDIRLTAAVPLVPTGKTRGRRIAVRASLKLPTGNAGALRGSGAADFSLGFHASHTGDFAGRELGLTGFAGVLLLGEGDLFPEIQKRTVGFGGIGAAWRAAERFVITAQVYAQGRYLESELDEIGGNSTQLSLGGTYRFARNRWSLSFAIAEDVFSDATTDVALHLAVRADDRSAR